MELKRNYIGLIVLHFLIALAIYTIKPLGKLYLPIVAVLGFFWIIKNENKNNEVLYVCGYLMGGEVLHRMTGGYFVLELAKYSIAFFCLLGIFFSGMSRKATVYLVFIVLLLPGVIIGSYTLSLQTDVRKNLIFNVFGPVVLAIASLYCYDKRLTFKELNNLLLAIGLPIVATAFYLFLYTPSIKDVVTGTSSNFETSGGFGPNQVSTILGLGAFIFFSRLLLESKNAVFFIINLGLLFYISFRGLVTFSRGGMMTSVAMIVVLLFVVYRLINSQAKNTLVVFIFISCFAFAGVWFYSSSQTSGLIENRYTNKDALGREKKSKLSGREDIMGSEIKMFKENPVFGVGAGRGRELRGGGIGYEQGVNSHNELTRMLGEHGSFGLLGLIILFLMPIIYFFKKDINYNIYTLPFLIFWLLTLNHAAMRLAAPAFIYALSLLKVYTLEEKPTVHRE